MPTSFKEVSARIIDAHDRVGWKSMVKVPDPRVGTKMEGREEKLQGNDMERLGRETRRPCSTLGYMLGKNMECWTGNAWIHTSIMNVRSNIIEFRLIKRIIHK